MIPIIGTSQQQEYSKNNNFIYLTVAQDPFHALFYHFNDFIKQVQL